MSRARTALRYRFGTLDEARAHVHVDGARQLFFYADPTVRLLPQAPVSLEWVFDDRQPCRLTHGWAVQSVDGRGTWLELSDVRPLRTIPTFSGLRRGRRFGCDVVVRVQHGGRLEIGRMLDVSRSGARLSGTAQLERGTAVELELLGPDRDSFHRLGPATVAWADGLEAGVEFDLEHAGCRATVGRILSRLVEVWASAWQGVHPKECCSHRGVLDPDPPRA